MEELFANNYFLIFYGLIFYYVILWGTAKNRKSKAKNARLELAETKEEKAMICADEKYDFNFKEWVSDNSDEMVIAAMASFLLIGFDQLASDYIKKTYDIELGRAVFLIGGIAGDLMYRAYAKMRG